MERMVLSPELEAEFHGFLYPIQVCSAEGTAVGVFLPLDNYKTLLAEFEIPYSKAELENRRLEKGGSTLDEFWQTTK
jgi:hypothetical protein